MRKDDEIYQSILVAVSDKRGMAEDDYNRARMYGSVGGESLQRRKECYERWKIVEHRVVNRQWPQ